MKDVATKAGVSASTICRALNNDSQIPEVTRKRIRKIADACGYVPDPLISAFAQRRRGGASGSDITTLAYVTHFDTVDGWITNPFYQPLFDGAREQARKNGFKLEHFWLGEPGMTGERFSRILHNRGIVGVCIAPTPNSRSRMTLEWSRFSAVTIGYSLIRPDLHRVTPHHFHALLTANRKLRRLGYSRIGFCLFEGTSGRVDDLWLAGALLTARRHPNTPMEVFLFNDDTRGRIAEWAIAAKLEVVVSDNAEALHELRSHGIRSPGEIDFATLNWTKAEADIAGINQRPAAIGAAAVDLLVAQIRRGERGIPDIPVTSMVEGAWVNGGSVLRVPVRPSP